MVPIARAETAFESGRAAFSVRFGDEECAFRVIGVYALPGETLEIEAVDVPPEDPSILIARSGMIETVDFHRWRWTAPRTVGHYPVEIHSSALRDTILLNVFVMLPYDSLSGGFICGYRIGEYPEEAYKGQDIYGPPSGFIEVTEATSDILVAPHFRLGQFLCKQPADGARYVVLRERLLLKLELILEEVNRRGHRADTFHIMSGYRTPHYNRAIGNVEYSRHLWGGAADIFIDHSPRNGMMDDLNGDGRIDLDDAGVLYDIIDSLRDEAWFEPYRGGLGKYPANAAHGPFVHIDVRGDPARW
jgi:hypothetical protein